MIDEGWSWVRAYESGTLSQTQLESLQTLVDDGEVESLIEAARLLDLDLSHRIESDSE